MSKSARCVAAVLTAGLLIAGGVLLLRRGLYGWTIFTLIPVCLGALSTWVFRPTTAGRAAAAGALATMFASASLLILGLEGIICILMSWPLAAPLGALGGWLAFRAARSLNGARSVAMLLLVAPVSLAWDVNARPPVFAVRTTIEIAAPPERVWKHVVSFEELPEPREWFFRAGIAYPKRARIEVSGAGAMRYCDFSTGTFVEPVEIWNEPRLLRFRVTENPAPMREWSPYERVMPRHLHGYLISKQGQFKLTPLGDNRTLLEGTSWYQHGLWPAEYWRWWSDATIHRIHLRVLNHIRMLAERESAGGASSLSR